MILKARESARHERGKFTLPASLLDKLEVDCGRWVLEKGASEAERCVRGRILSFLDERERLKREEDERKVKLRMPPEK